MKNQRLIGIQLARGIAALMLVLYHGGRMIALPQYAGHQGFGGFFAFGHSGVDFFFVLSGFIIYFVHRADLGRPSGLLRYAWRRVARIYPSYWLVLAVVVALLLAKHDPALTPAHFIRSLLLLPDTQETLLGVAWTLLHEVLFYAAFALAIIDLRLGLFVALLWIATIVTGLGMQSSLPFLRLAGAPINLQFLIGIAAAYVVLNMQVRFASLLAIAGVGAFFAAGFAENAGLIAVGSTTGDMIYGVCAGIAIVGIASAEQQGQLRFGRIGEFFGGTSYLLYLVHTIVIGFCFRGLAAAGLIRAMPDWIAVLIATFFSIVIASFLYKFFEQPVQGALNRFGRERIFARKQPA